MVDRIVGEDQLLGAVLANPTDDVPRLIWADWLEQAGRAAGRAADVARAELIRLQCTLTTWERWASDTAVVPCPDLLPPTRQSRQAEGTTRTEASRTEQLRQREQQLISRFQSAWLGAAAACVKKFTVQWSRGLPERLSGGARVTNSDLAAIPKLPGLQVVDLRACRQVTSAEVRRLRQGQPGLQVLHRSVYRLAEALADHGDFRTALASVGAALRLTSANQICSLRLTTATDQCVDALAGRFSGEMAHLQSLELNGAPVTDRGIRSLTGLRRQLRLLDLSGTNLTDTGLAHISRLTELQELSLGWTNISNAGLAHLTRLEMLQCLDLGAGDFGGDDYACHRVTSGGVKRLQRLLPGLVVF